MRYPFRDVPIIRWFQQSSLVLLVLTVWRLNMNYFYSLLSCFSYGEPWRSLLYPSIFLDSSAYYPFEWHKIIDRREVNIWVLSSDRTSQQAPVSPTCLSVPEFSASLTEGGDIMHGILIAIVGAVASIATAIIDASTKDWPPNPHMGI